MANDEAAYRSSDQKSKSRKEEKYSASPVRELRSLCKERGLRVSGSKDVVIKRLIEDEDFYEHSEAAERAAAASAAQKISSFRRNILCAIASIIVAIILNSFKLDRKKNSVFNSTTISQHRGKIIGARVTSKDLADAYHSIKREYASLALTENARWELLSTHADGSQVSLLKHKTDPSCPYVRMTSIMPASVQDVWDFLSLDNWPKTMPKMDPFYEGLTVLGEYRHKGIEMRLARKTVKRIVAFGKRDFTFVSVSDHPRSDGAWVSGTVSVVTEQLPRKKGYTRAFQDSIAFYEPLKADDKTGRPRTKLTIVFRIDLNDSTEGGSGGFVPMWMYVKTVGTTGMLSVQNMKKQLQIMTVGRDYGKCELNWLDRLLNSSKCES